MSRPMKFTIPGELPGTNEILAASNHNRHVYAAMKRDNTRLVAVIARRLPQCEAVDVTVTWHCKDKRKDKDNIAGGIKFILDGLVMAGVIKNDGWKQIGNIIHKYEVDGKNPRIEVELTKINSGA